MVTYDVDVQCPHNSDLDSYYEQEKEVQLLSSPLMDPG